MKVRPMLPADFDANLRDSHYREILFTIDPNQFDDETAIMLPRAEWECRFETDKEAREVAQKLADITGQKVEVQTYGYWGHSGREYVDFFNVEPIANHHNHGEVV